MAIVSVIVIILSLGLIVVAWIVSRRWPVVTSIAVRLVAIGIGMAASGLVMDNGDGSLVAVGGVILSRIGIIFLIVGVITFGVAIFTAQRQSDE